MRNRTLLSATLALTIATPLAISPLHAQRAAAAPASAAPAAWADFARRFDAECDSARIVGASAILVQDGRIVARRDHGLADRARNQRVDERTLFHYGSITKTLTAIAVMQLRDRGKLSLDDRITRWVPELRQLHDPYGMIDSITLRMLLSHSAGFQNPTWPYKAGKPWEPFEPTTWNQLVAMMPYQELLFRPGAKFSYSNPGYIYLARVIEQLTGDPWETYIQKNILTPLGLVRSYFGATPYWLAADRSNNYSHLKDSTGVESLRENGRDFDPGITIPNGGWNAPLSDLATYSAFLMGATNGDTALARRWDLVLPRKTLEEMWHPVVMTSPPGAAVEQGVGLGFFIAKENGHTIIGHTGSQAAFNSFLWVRPDVRRAVMVVFNTDTEIQEGRSPFAPVQRAALALLR